eukprot:CAMPEP_0202875712 /NCGR_PEP_ID=MMETSP1391-20130828/27799_1 /ASSEMBLY_ACC=CAM_ASM_000867 /TAXON_ID=1034604 /ORGANISM="Chlamydomonas leiostraca, Strain SAG 11-49" /LENGTH=209 /DNA_ID=CAMNT_0049557439 /DNA_START=22 /DNA_END=647 /DNA_ORIENTATION=-
MAMYNFADVEPKFSGRRNRALMKKEERQLGEAVDGLAHMTEKQLKALSPLVGEQVLDAVRIAAKLPRSNQGRKRQEGLVAKLLRDRLDDDAMAQLFAAVEAAKTSSASYQDPRIATQAATWKEGLLAGEQGVMEEVLAVITRVAAAARSGDAAADGQEEDEDQEEAGTSGSEDDNDDQEAGDAENDSQHQTVGSAGPAQASTQLPEPQR